MFLGIRQKGDDYGRAWKNSFLAKAGTELSWDRRDELDEMSYEDYLKTDEWRTIRQLALINANWCCQICGVRSVFHQVHHRLYPKRGSEGPGDVIVACAKCHRDVHGIKETSLAKVRVETGVCSIDRPSRYDPEKDGAKPSKFLLQIIAQDAWRDPDGWDVEHDDLLPAW